METTQEKSFRFKKYFVYIYFILYIYLYIRIYKYIVLYIDRYIYIYNMISIYYIIYIYIYVTVMVSPVSSDGPTVQTQQYFRGSKCLSSSYTWILNVLFVLVC